MKEWSDREIYLLSERPTSLDCAIRFFPCPSVSIHVNLVRRKSLSRKDGKEAEGYIDHLDDCGACHIRMRTRACVSRGGSREDEVVNRVNNIFGIPYRVPRVVGSIISSRQ